MISFLMPAKNTSFYITDAIMPFINNYYKYNFELIIIDDFSTDDTFNIITNLTNKYDRLNIYKNSKK